MNLATVSVDGSSGGGHEQGWWDDQQWQGCHHQGHQAEKFKVVIEALFHEEVFGA